jgi:NAD(P)-dependent dehydrogenase (short-subunit alcohol dehydrogenase family)
MAANSNDNTTEYGYEAGRVALVTGAATGIGRDVALAFARAGLDVAVLDRDAERGEKTAEEIRGLGRRALFVACDVADEEQVVAAHKRVVDELGSIDAAVNNAGIEGQNAQTDECSMENFDRVFSVNIRGTFMCLREQIRQMKKQETGGAVVNMASVAGSIGFPGLPAYCASKGAVVQLTRTAAIECATQKIRVNAVAPGVVKTEMIERTSKGVPEIEAVYNSLCPMNRMAAPSEIAGSCVFACSPRASFMTGSILTVDGGFTTQ